MVLVMDAGGPEPVELDGLHENYTYNCSGMLVEAVGTSLSEMDGWTGERVAEALGRAVEDMTVNPAKYRAMNPPNGWGDADGWRAYLSKIRDACIAAPRATLDVH